MIAFSVKDLPLPAAREEDALAREDAAQHGRLARVERGITINIPFGKDNHQDSTLETEAEQTTSGVLAINRLWQELEASGLSEHVTFATMNVFGRTLNRNGSGGRNHNRKHAVMAAFGPNIRAGVYGGVINRECSGIDPITGAASESGGIAPEQTMESMGKSLAVAMGHSRESVNVRIRGGQVIESLIR